MALILINLKRKQQSTATPSLSRVRVINTCSKPQLLCINTHNSCERRSFSFLLHSSLSLDGASVLVPSSCLLQRKPFFFFFGFGSCVHGDLGGGPILPALWSRHLSLHRARVQVPREWTAWSLLHPLSMAPTCLQFTQVPTPHCLLFQFSISARDPKSSKINTTPCLSSYFSIC